MIRNILSKVDLTCLILGGVFIFYGIYSLDCGVIEARGAYISSSESYYTYWLIILHLFGIGLALLYHSFFCAKNK